MNSVMHFTNQYHNEKDTYKCITQIYLNCDAFLFLLFFYASRSLYSEFNKNSDIYVVDREGLNAVILGEVTIYGQIVVENFLNRMK